jgi:hypothetical protein
MATYLGRGIASMRRNNFMCQEVILDDIRVHWVGDNAQGAKSQSTPKSIVICFSIPSFPSQGIRFAPAPHFNMSSFLPSLSSNRSKKVVRKVPASTTPNNHANRDPQRERINWIFDQYRGTSTTPRG